MPSQPGGTPSEAGGGGSYPAAGAQSDRKLFTRAVSLGGSGVFCTSSLIFDSQSDRLCDILFDEWTDRELFTGAVPLGGSGVFYTLRPYKRPD